MVSRNFQNSCVYRSLSKMRLEFFAQDSVFDNVYVPAVFESGLTPSSFFFHSKIGCEFLHGNIVGKCAASDALQIHRLEPMLTNKPRRVVPVTFSPSRLVADDDCEFSRAIHGMNVL